MAVQLTQEMIQGAQETERLTGVPSSITLGQIIYESSGNYEGGLSKLAYKGKNLFGVKSFSDSDKKIYMTNSDGYVAWKKYDSFYDSIVDHANILQLDRYKSRYQNATSVSDYAYALQEGGYAGTSKTYAQGLLNVIDTYSLNQYNLSESDNSLDLNEIIKPDTNSSNNSILNNLFKPNTGNATNTESNNKGVESQKPVVNVGNSEDTTLDIFGQILKYLLIVLIALIGTFFIIKALGIEM